MGLFYIILKHLIPFHILYNNYIKNNLEISKMEIINMIFQNKNTEITIPFSIWNKITNVTFKDQKYFSEFPISFEKRLMIWDLELYYEIN